MSSHEIHHTWSGQLTESGGIHLPAAARDAIGWSAGTEVVLEWDGHSLRVLPTADFTREIQQTFGPWQSGEPLLSEELLADRRRDAAVSRSA